MFRTRILAIFLALACFVGATSAQDHDHAATEHLGTVHFETSCSPQAQVEFDHAVALLHSFQFGRARESFNSVLKTDPNCAMAYWGIALIEWSNPFAPGVKSPAQIEAGKKDVARGLQLMPKTERERSYLLAVGKLYTDSSAQTQQARIDAFRDAMGELSRKHPEDHEAAIYYALALAESEPLGDKTHAQRLKAGAILEALFKQEPDHPGLAHYIIHAYDTPDLAAKAVAAAREYGKIAPDAPHALHMPSHTFTRVGYWQESIESNIAAAQAAEREHQYGEELHTMDYRVYAYLQTGQDEAARKIVEAVPEVVGKLNVANGLASAAPPSAGQFAIAAIAARYALERQDWPRAASLQPASTSVPYADAMTWFAKGMGAARLKQTKTAQESAEALAGLVQKLKQANEDYWATQVEIQHLEVAAWAQWSMGDAKDKQEAMKLMEQAASLEDTTDKSAVTPGPLAPARELLGEMLLQADNPKRAFEQFELTIKKEPNRFLTIYYAAQAARQSGDSAKSRDYYQKLVKICERGDKPGRKELQEARGQ